MKPAAKGPRGARARRPTTAAQTPRIFRAGKVPPPRPAPVDTASPSADTGLDDDLEPGDMVPDLDNPKAPFGSLCPRLSQRAPASERPLEGAPEAEETLRTGALRQAYTKRSGRVAMVQRRCLGKGKHEVRLVDTEGIPFLVAQGEGGSASEALASLEQAWATMVASGTVPAPPARPKGKAVMRNRPWHGGVPGKRKSAQGG